MVAKIFGLASGALVASLGVWGFNTWRHVSDESRFVSVITDHCMPFIRTGQTPFEGLGRTAGVYDAADLSENITGGGNKIIFDNRFVAQWGESTDQNSRVRVCQVNYSYVSADNVGFEMPTDELDDIVKAALGRDANVVTLNDVVTDVPNMLIWGEPDAPTSTGLRFLITAQTGSVLSVLVADDIPG